MSKGNLFRIIDLAVFAGLVSVSAFSFTNKTFSAKLDAIFLPEERNKGFYEVINNGSEEIEEADEGTSCYKYSFLKGALDGEIVTEDDWKLLSNTIRYQMQSDMAVMDFRDGTGIVVNKSEYPKGTYGKLDGLEVVDFGETIDISDYAGVVTSIMGDDDANDKNLQDITDFYTYLKALDNKDYTIFVAIQDEGTAALNRKLVELLSKLGMNTNLLEHAEDDIYNKIYYRNSYYAVLSQGVSLDENVSEEKLSASGKLTDGTEYQIESAGYSTGDSDASIRVNGNEYAVNYRGMNFVVFDMEKQEVIDSVCFDTYEGLLCSR